MEIQEFKTKVVAIGEALKMSVIFPSDENIPSHKWANLIKDNQKIRISNGGYQNEHKLHISGDFPRTSKEEYCHYGQSPSINVSDSKTAEQVARDIERRFFPIYLPELEKAVNQVNATNLFHEKRRANIQKLADYFQVAFKEDKEPSIWVYEKIKGLGSKIEVRGEDTVKFELEVTPEMAVKIFDLLKS